MKYFNYFNQVLAIALGVLLILMCWRWYAPKLTVTTAQAESVWALCKPLPYCRGIRLELHYDAANRHYFPMIRVYAEKEILKSKTLGKDKQELGEALLSAYQAHASRSFSPLRFIQQRARVEVQL